MTAIALPSAEYQTVTDACGVLDRSQRGKLALAGSAAKEFLQGQVSNDVESLSPGEGCYSAFLTPKGKMLGDLRILDSGDELLLDTERVGASGAVQHDPPVQHRLRRRSCTSARSSAACSRSWVPGPRRVIGGAGSLGEAEHANAEVSIGGVAARAIRTDLGVDLLCDSADSSALLTALAEAGAVPVSEARGRVPAGRARPPALRRRSRRERHPPGGRAQRASRVLHQGLLCRPGDRRAALLPGQAKPAAAGVAAVSGRRFTARSSASTGGVVGRTGSVALSPRFGPIALALVRREAPLGAEVQLGSGVTAEIVDLPFS